MRTRVIMSIVTAVLAAASLHASQTAAPDVLLARAREALGGDRALSAITSFRVKGSVTLPGSRGGASGSFEIVCELPDRFVQTEDHGEFWAGETVTSDNGNGFHTSYQHAKLGFVGNDLVYEPPARDAGWTNTSSRSSTDVTPEARLKGLAEARVGFVNLTLGMFAASFAGMPVTFAPAQEPDAVLVTGDGVIDMLHFDPVTHLPAALSVTSPPAFVPRVTGASRQRLTYADYRDVHGVTLPFRIATNSETWTVKTFELNPHVDPKVFRPIVRSR